MSLEYRIIGSDLEVLEVCLQPGQKVKAQPGTMNFMTGDIEMQTSTGGGIFSGIKRKISGENFFIASFENRGNDKGYVGVSSYYPGKIQPIDLSKIGNVFYCQQRTFLAAEQDVDISIGFTRKLGAGLFGGEGFILQKLSGSGLAFIHAGGVIIKKELLPGEVLRVDTGCLLGFSQTVDYDISMVSGILNPIFGGEGFFLAKMTGPGIVLLQSLPFVRLVDNIIAAHMESAKKSR